MTRITKQVTVEGVDAEAIFTEFNDLKRIITESSLNHQGEQKHRGILTRSEVAERLKISLPTLHDWTKKGIL